jgi:hypothetical protein
VLMKKTPGQGTFEAGRSGGLQELLLGMVGNLSETDVKASSSIVGGGGIAAAVALLAGCSDQAVHEAVMHLVPPPSHLSHASMILIQL